MGSAIGKKPRQCLPERWIHGRVHREGFVWMLLQRHGHHRGIMSSEGGSFAKELLNQDPLCAGMH